ncbi:valine--tRNA ligase [Candidatus Peregrinibacteria bacterium HGW-Peregrinibacteria-1]|jgi:valyl-tRNA synthetase|nr:MAG: valine--tRNA ligase [Candidatus Peregrinibacteria bacterium HGW-Peregrinibacteria-1]
MPIELEKAYEPGKYEDQVYAKWEKSGSFSPKPSSDKEPFVISMPPPNATGTLHLGHAVMIALQDIMIRYNRMLGKPTLWIPGTDHAAIATQSVVEKNLMKQGVKKPRQELGREKLLQEIREFVANSQSTIKNQVRKMGASCDWTREKYTLDPQMNTAVNRMFKYMNEDGLIYRGGRIVNWDPKMQTTVADDEMEYISEKTKFYYFQFGPVVIGTARPETKFLDKVIVVHPEDKRYQDLIGKEFEIEWINGPTKARVIADSCIDMEMGTGAMSITPAHSLVDFELAEKYNLESPQIIDFEGNIMTEVSEEFGGMPIEEAREKIVEKLEERGLLIKIDHEYEHNIAINYRGKGLIEPQIMKQWFIDVNKKVIDWKGAKLSIKEVLQDAVNSKMINIIPSRFEKTYFNWIDNLRDWCISRQIWWGHQIPIWYQLTAEQYKTFIESGEQSSTLLNVMKVESEPVFSESKPDGDHWIQDPDTLDTWFSSALWTFSTLGWPENTEDFKNFHPTSVLETGYDIIFFWVARMILASTYTLRREGISEEKSIPFKNIYLHGLIRDRRGKKMSKSHPETCIDPLEMIEKYGTDAVRLSLIIGNTPGNDMRLYEEKISGYRNFANKLWNASRFALSNIDEADLQKEFTADLITSDADRWIVSKTQELITATQADIENFRFSDAGNRLYEFTWNIFCDWYLEISKTQFNPYVLGYVLKALLKMLHPFTPFVTETIWSHLQEKELLIASLWPEQKEEYTFPASEELLETVINIISLIRSKRAELKVPPAKLIKANIVATPGSKLQEQSEIIIKLARLSALEFIASDSTTTDGSVVIIENGIEIRLPMEDLIDKETEIKRLTKEIANKEQAIKSLEGKLGNPGFLDKAPPEVVDGQREKLREEQESLSGLIQNLEKIKN